MNDVGIRGFALIDSGGVRFFGSLVLGVLVCVRCSLCEDVGDREWKHLATVLVLGGLLYVAFLCQLCFWALVVVCYAISTFGLLW